MYVCMYLTAMADSLGALHMYTISIILLWRFGPYSGHGLHSSKYFTAVYFSSAVFSCG
jgi:hypothetical protein